MDHTSFRIGYCAVSSKLLYQQYILSEVLLKRNTEKGYMLIG